MMTPRERRWPLTRLGSPPHRDGCRRLLIRVSHSDVGHGVLKVRILYKYFAGLLFGFLVVVILAPFSE